MTRIASLPTAPTAVLTLLLACGYLACGHSTGKEDDPGKPPASSCEGAVTRICTRACSCTGAKCRWVAGGKLGGFDSLQGCTDYFSGSECKGGGRPGFDYGKCSDAADAAACVDNAIVGKALTYPTECPLPS